MILVFGGAYQGKVEFAKEQFGLTEVYDCGARAAGEADGTTGAAEVADGRAKTAEAADGSGAGIEPTAFSCDIISGLEQFVRDCCAPDPDERIEAADWMRSHKDAWQDKILVITDVSQGIVPVDARARAFREMNGRLMLYLASEASEVWRVFCGIGRRIR